jgi:CubicO group peptidase (beta-lactamase class C family)
MSDDWKTAPATKVGMDERRLCSIPSFLDSVANSNVHSVLVVRSGALVFEHYRNGDDEIGDRAAPNASHDVNTKHDLRSVSKGITSLLLGIAWDRKLIADIDEPVLSYFPQYSDLAKDGRDRITIRHHLTMASGLAWNEYLPYTDPKNSQTAMLRSADPLRFVLQQQLVDAPGTIWSYNSGSTELLGAIIAKASGATLDAFAEKALFAPLGISDVGWWRFADGRPGAAAGLQLRPRDLAKIGQLLLQRGRWNDKQIVSEHWLDEATAPQIGPGDRLYFYGYQWWLGRSLVKRKALLWVAGQGLGGQRLILVPSLDLVCVITAGHYRDEMQTWLPLLLLNQHVLAAAE